ncbi:hypothetical protein [Ancylobacter moscoviensis]
MINRIMAGGTYIYIIRHGQSLIVASDSKVSSPFSETQTCVKITQLGSHRFFTAIGEAATILDPIAGITVYDSIQLANEIYSDSQSLEENAALWSARIDSAMKAHYPGQIHEPERLVMGVFGDVSGSEPYVVECDVFGSGNADNAITARIVTHRPNRDITFTDPVLINEYWRWHRRWRQNSTITLDDLAEEMKLLMEFIIRHPSTDKATIGGAPSVLIADHDRGTRWHCTAPVLS